MQEERHRYSSSGRRVIAGWDLWRLCSSFCHFYQCIWGRKQKVAKLWSTQVLWHPFCQRPFLRSPPSRGCVNKKQLGYKPEIPLKYLFLHPDVFVELFYIVTKSKRESEDLFITDRQHQICQTLTFVSQVLGSAADNLNRFKPMDLPWVGQHLKNLFLEQSRKVSLVSHEDTGVCCPWLMLESKVFFSVLFCFFNLFVYLFTLSMWVCV